MEAAAPKGNDDGHEAKKGQDDRREVQQAHPVETGKTLP